MTGQPSRAELLAEIARLRQQCAVWETGALAALLAAGLDPATAARVRARIVELTPIAGAR